MEYGMLVNDHLYCVIMAGGIGSRFWPLSRVEKPKQFVDALGIGKTFIQMTYERFARFIPGTNFLVMTGEDYKELVLEQLPELHPDQVLTEPCRRSTAPCIAYAMFKLKQRDPNAVAIVTPSDQYIGNGAAFERIMRESLDYAGSHPCLLTVGISPTYPATGYGYIQTRPEAGEAFTPVCRFKEKPDLATATAYLSEGNYYWNSGMFIWSVEAIFTTLMLEKSFLCPTAYLEEPSEEFAWADLIRETREHVELNHALSNSFGFGGSNACIVLSRWK